MSDPAYPVRVSRPIPDEPGFGVIKRVRDAVYRHVAPDRIIDIERRQDALERIDEMERQLLRHVDSRERLLREVVRYVELM